MINAAKLSSYVLYVSYNDNAFDAGSKKNDYEKKSELFENLFLLILIADVVDSGFEATKYNRKLYKNIFGEEPPSFSLNFRPTYQGANLTMSYSFN